MKATYYIFDIKESPKSLVIYKNTLNRKIENKFFHGSFIEEPLQTELYVEGRNPPDLLTSGGLLVASKRLKMLFDQLIINGVQFIPAKVIHKSGIEVPGYHIINVLNIYSAWDKENTVWVNEDQKDAGQYPEFNVWRVALKKEVIGNLHIFRLEKPQFPIYISKYLKEEIEKHKFDVGVGFYPVYAY
jgi:hypothetical protein